MAEEHEISLEGPEGPALAETKSAEKSTVHRISEQSDSEAGAGKKNDSLKLHSDGVTVLQPQPSNDPRDPLNWPHFKKLFVFSAMLPGCMLSDWTMTWGTTMFQIQAPEWNTSVTHASQSMAGGIFMQGPGGLLAVPLCQRYGRLPVLFWSQLLSLVCTIGATYAEGYGAYTACRTLQGFFGAAPQVIGLSIIHDMFFFHERTRMINVWVLSFLVGPYIGPFISAFLLEAIDWRDTFKVLTGFYGLSLLLIVLLGDETLFDRATGSEAERPLLQTQNSFGKKLLAHLSLLTGITGVRNSHLPNRPTLLKSTGHLFSVFARPYVFIPTLGHITILTMWTIGLVSTFGQFILPPPYHFSQTNFALMFFAPMIGTLLAEAWGHVTNDAICRFYLKRHAGQWKPETRLWGVYIPWVITMVGLIVYGQGLQKTMHWPVLAVGWAMDVFGTLAVTTAVSAYLLDSLPHHAALSGAWLNATRTVGGFSVTWFIAPWVQRNGPGVVFGVQAATVGAAILSIVATQHFGPKWRKMFPAPEPEN